MNFIKYKYNFIKKNLFFVLLIFISIIFSADVIKASNNRKNIELDQFTKRFSKYSLDTGDQLNIRIFNFKELSSNVTILPDGTINLPRIKTLNISGLSLEEAKLLIENEYKKLIKTPIVYLDIVNTRPIKVNILGEVQVPGLYSQSKSENNNLRTKGLISNEVVQTKGWPTLIDSIQKAGGFTIYSDLRNINITRKDKSTGELVTTKINLWDSISNKNYFENPFLYDGDVIVVGKIQALNESEIYTISNSAFSPANITIDIVGAVLNPGKKKIRTNTRLMEAIYSAGGLRRFADKSKIKLVRMKSNGGIYKKDFKYNNKLLSNNILNPYLKDGDIIIVQNNKFKKTTDLLSDIVAPIDPIIRSKMLLDLFEE